VARLLVLLCIELPALIVDLWFRVYVVLIAVGSLFLWGMGLIGLTLWLGWGIRWGW
jgi:hypothetical protein